jgi:hypothetical protein
MAKSGAGSSREVAFFLSYARNDIEQRPTEFEIFSKELEREVKLVTGCGVEGFWDGKIEHGNAWQPRIEEALADCVVFVALVSPSYLRSEACTWERREFASKLGDRVGDGFLVPVIWIPSRAALPAEIAKFHYQPAGLGPTYVKGLSFQIEQAYEEYRGHFLPSLAKHIGRLFEDHTQRLASRAESRPSRPSVEPTQAFAAAARTSSTRHADPGASAQTKSKPPSRQVMPGEFASTLMVHHHVANRPIDSASVQMCFDGWKSAVKRASETETSVDYLQLSIQDQNTIYPDLNDTSAMGQTIRTLRGVLEPRPGGWKQPFFDVLDRIHSHRYFADRFVLVVDKREKCLKNPVPLDLLGPTVYLYLDNDLLQDQTKDALKYVRLCPEKRSKLRDSIRVASPLCWETMVQHESSPLLFPHGNTPVECRAGCGLARHTLEDYLEGCFKAAVVEGLLGGMAFFSINNLRESKNATHKTRHILYSGVRSGAEFIGGIVLYSQRAFTVDANQLADAYKLAMLSSRSQNGSPSQPATLA